MAERDSENYYLEGYFDFVSEPAPKKVREKKTRHMSAGKCALIVLAVVVAICALVAAVYLIWTFDVVVTGNEGNVNIRVMRVDRRAGEIDIERPGALSELPPEATPPADPAAPGASGPATLRIT
ncbi:MAG: hypothetical protein J6P71_07040, partial [Oscillospiraceae bacterium]|nr:hypothetical protein [Oscillospiraceae bacterium]